MTKLPRKALAVVFDMDGLLFDTETLYRDAMIAVAAEQAIEMPISFYMTLIGLSGEATSRALKDRFGDGFDFESYWLSASKRFHAMAETRSYMKAGVVELLDALDSASIPRAIATSSSHRDVQRHLDTHGLLDRFGAVVAKGDYARGKPNPDPFLTAAERLGCTPESCLALEDSHHGVRAASSAGMMTIMVPDLLAATAEMEELCLCVAKDLHEVRSLMALRPE